VLLATGRWCGGSCCNLARLLVGRASVEVWVEVGVANASNLYSWLVFCFWLKGEFVLGYGDLLLSLC